VAPDSSARSQPAQTLHQYLRRLNGLWLAPLLAVALALGSYSVFQVHRQRSTEVRTLAARLAADIDADLQRRLHGLQALSVSISRSHPAGSLRDWYDEARDYDQTFNAPVLLVDGSRRVLFSSRLALGTPMPMLPKPPGRLDLEDALATGKPKIGDVVFGPIVGHRVVPITVPVAGTRMAIVGVVVVDHYAELILRQRLPAAWQATVVDSTGQLIGSAGSEAAGAGPPGAQATGAAPPTGGLGAMREARLAVAGTVSAPFRVMVHVDRLDFYRPHLQIGLALLLSVTMAVVGVALVARRASQGLLASVARLANGRATGHGVGPVGPPAAMPRIVEIEAARDALAKVGQAVHEAEEAERERIGRELHDGLQQEAAAAKMFLDLAEAELERGSNPIELLGRGRKGLEKVMQGIDDAVRDLRPRELSMLGLSASLEQLVQQLRVLGNLRVELEFIGPQDAVDALPQPVANVLYRIAQESLNNVRKHARASFVHVALDTSNPAEVRLVVSDDGIGLSWLPGHEGASVGLRGMLHRAKSVRGELRVEKGLRGDAQRGTTVTVRIPLEHPPAR
jgi:signal transduction histidine kinase